MAFRWCVAMVFRISQNIVDMLFFYRHSDSSWVEMNTKKHRSHTSIPTHCVNWLWTISLSLHQTNIISYIVHSNTYTHTALTQGQYVDRYLKCHLISIKTDKTKPNTHKNRSIWWVFLQTTQSWRKQQRQKQYTRKKEYCPQTDTHTFSRSENVPSEFPT